MGSGELINKNKLFNIVLIAVVLFIALKIYEGQSKKIDLLKVAIIEEGRKNQVLEDIAELDERIASYQGLLERKEESAYINDINTLARNSNVRLLSIRPSGENRFSDYTKYSFELSVLSADYDSLAIFINAIEVSKTFFTVDNFNIQSESYNKEKEIKADLLISAIALSGR